jgi:hypothetical protein
MIANLRAHRAQKINKNQTQDLPVILYITWKRK